ncbi:MAG: 6,7-dimethyl-8-ribityllumazine synthase [Desulfonatronovibrio sp.]
MQDIRTVEGKLDARNLKIALVASRFNDFIVDKLLGGAIDYLVRHGLDKKNLTVYKIPGAFEFPVVVKKLSQTREYDGIVCIGAVIRGATPHFDYVASEATKGIAQTSLETGIPVGFGLLTTDTLEQAIERAGSKAGNKGVDAAAALLETIRVLEQIN